MRLRARGRKNGLCREPPLPLSNGTARVAALLGSLSAEGAAVADTALSPTQPYPAAQAALRITRVEWTRTFSGTRVSSWEPWTFCPRGLPRQCTHGTHDVSGLTSWAAPVGGRLLPAGVWDPAAENKARRALPPVLRPPMSRILAGTVDPLRQPSQALRHDPLHGVRVGKAAVRTRLLLLIYGTSARWLPLQSAGLVPAHARLCDLERDSRGLSSQGL